MLMRWGLTLSLLVASVSPAVTESTRCPNDFLKEPMNTLAIAMGDQPLALEGKDCAAQSALFLSVAQKVQDKLSPSSAKSPTFNSTAIATRRIAIASIVLSVLALMSAPFITIMLFRRYGLISWRLHVGD